MPEMDALRSTAALDRLPHRAPFRFLTSVSACSVGQDGMAAWEVQGSEDFFRGHFPGEPVVPGVLIAEALAQLAGLVGLHAETDEREAAGDRGGRLVHVDVRFDQAVMPPARIELRATLTRELGLLRQFDVLAEVNGSPVARGTLTLAQVGGRGESAE